MVVNNAWAQKNPPTSKKDPRAYFLVGDSSNIGASYNRAAKFPEISNVPYVRKESQHYNRVPSEPTILTRLLVKIRTLRVKDARD